MFSACVLIVRARDKLCQVYEGSGKTIILYRSFNSYIFVNDVMRLTWNIVALLSTQLDFRPDDRSLILCWEKRTDSSSKLLTRLRNLHILLPVITAGFVSISTEAGHKALSIFEFTHITPYLHSPICLHYMLLNTAQEKP
jgi:hypothetical protein